MSTFAAPAVQRVSAAPSGAVAQTSEANVARTIRKTVEFIKGEGGAAMNENRRSAQMLVHSSRRRADRSVVGRSKSLSCTCQSDGSRCWIEGQRPCTSQPRASEARAPPWVSHDKKDNALKGRHTLCPAPSGRCSFLSQIPGRRPLRRGLAL